MLLTCQRELEQQLNLQRFLASNSARRASKVSMLALVAGTALPCGKRKLRAKPDLTTTWSPRPPRFAILV